MNDALFGVVLTLSVFYLGDVLSKLHKSPLLNGFLISVVLGISFLLVFNIPFEKYQPGGDFINFFLSPAVVLLAIPLYKQLDNIKKNLKIFILGILFAVTINFILITLSLMIFDLDKTIGISFFPKSITTAMAIELSKIIGGNPSISVIMVFFAGTTGAVFGKTIIKLLKIKTSIAKGIGFGASSHATGTSVALEIGEDVGAISAASIGVTGIVTVLVMPQLINLVLHLI